MNTSSARVAAACLMIAAAEVVQGQTTVLTFNDVVCRSSLLTYSLAGYSLSALNLQRPGPASFFSHCPGDSGYAGSTALWVLNTEASFTTLISENGWFAIRSIDIATTFPNGIGGLLAFEGRTRDGTRVRQEFTVGNSNPVAFTTLTFGAEFTDLLSLTWLTGPLNRDCGPRQGMCLFYGNAHVQFDNVVVVSTAPEPSTLALMGSGLVWVGIMASRRRKKHVTQVEANVAAAV
jgi:hypothetical protein